MNPDAAKTIPAGYLGEQSHAEFVREAYREQGRKEEQERIIKLVRQHSKESANLHYEYWSALANVISLIKGEQK